MDSEREGWTPYVSPFPDWLRDMADGEYEVNGYKFELRTENGKRVVSYRGWRDYFKEVGYDDSMG
ncbi:MAG: hypothetical protein WC822_04580 [Candidatus Paceibacterota bacterium]